MLFRFVRGFRFVQILISNNVCTREPHANVIKRIGRYLIATKDKCIRFKPTCDLSHFESFVDADFAGAYVKETCEDPTQ